MLTKTNINDIKRYTKTEPQNIEQFIGIFNKLTNDEYDINAEFFDIGDIKFNDFIYTDNRLMLIAAINRQPMKQVVEYQQLINESHLLNAEFVEPFDEMYFLIFKNRTTHYLFVLDSDSNDRYIVSCDHSITLPSIGPKFDVKNKD